MLDNNSLADEIAAHGVSVTDFRKVLAESIVDRVIEVENARPEADAFLQELVHAAIKIARSDGAHEVGIAHLLQVLLQSKYPSAAVALIKEQLTPASLDSIVAAIERRKGPNRKS